MPSEVHVFTDHANLTFDTSLDANSAQRWKLVLAEYDIILHHKKESENLAADYLSRCFIARKTNEIPRNIKTIHDELSHPGIECLYQTGRRMGCPIGDLKGIIKMIKRNCEKCKNYFRPTKNYGHLKGHLNTNEPFEHLSSDIYGQVPGHLFEDRDERNMLYILTITDRCTRWTEPYLLANITSQEINRGIQHYFKKFRKPISLLSDRGRQYISQNFENFLKKEGVKHLITSPYNPTGNSISERINQTI